MDFHPESFSLFKFARSSLINFHTNLRNGRGNKQEEKSYATNYDVEGHLLSTVAIKDILIRRGMELRSVC